MKMLNAVLFLPKLLNLLLGSALEPMGRHSNVQEQGHLRGQREARDTYITQKVRTLLVCSVSGSLGSVPG